MNYYLLEAALDDDAVGAENETNEDVEEDGLLVSQERTKFSSREQTRT